MNNISNYEEYEKTIIQKKLDINKTISLRNLIKNNCKTQNKSIKNKLKDKKFSFKDNEKWYAVALNYLIEKGILETERLNNGDTFHNVTYEYQKYFTVPKSTRYSPSNNKNHLILYKETSKEFLEISGLIPKQKKEPQKIKKENIINEKNRLYFRIAAGLLLGLSLFNWIRLISMYGFSNLIPMFLNCIMLLIATLIFML